MNQTRRTLSYWILTALLERGCDSPSSSRRGHHWEPAHSIRALSPGEIRELGGPYLKLRFLPSPLPRLKG